MNTESNDTDPFADLDALPARLETAIEAITTARPHAEQSVANGMTRGMRGGAAAGILIGAAINAYYALAVDDETGPAIDVHHSLVAALESCAGNERVNVAHTLINILVSWLANGNMAEQVGLHADSASQHLEAAYRHIADGAYGLDDDEHVHVTHVHGTDDAPYAPNSVPSGAVERLGEAASALGISPIIVAEGGDDTDHAHPLVPVALMSGIVTGRATMEFIDMSASADEHMQAHAAPLWVTGFANAVAFGGEPSEDTVAAAALRLVHIIGRWHDNRTGAKYAPAIGALCRAANHAGRAAGLGSADIAVRAEHIAHGTDEQDAARKALEAAEEAVKALKDTGITM
jgi:hypothetical protein